MKTHETNKLKAIIFNSRAHAAISSHFLHRASENGTRGQGFCSLTIYLIYDHNLLSFSKPPKAKVGVSVLAHLALPHMSVSVGVPKHSPRSPTHPLLRCLTPPCRHWIRLQLHKSNEKPNKEKSRKTKYKYKIQNTKYKIQNTKYKIHDAKYKYEKSLKGVLVACEKQMSVRREK